MYKVSEIIEMLKTLPQDKIVFVTDCEGRAGHLMGVETDENKPEKKYGKWASYLFVGEQNK